jgi:hypothetical protein
MSDNTLATNDSATDATGVQNSENQAQATKSYTQDEVNDMMARMRGSLEKKLTKQWEGLGDPEELRQLKTDAEKRQQEQQLKRGEFEKTLQDIVAKKDAEIQRRDSVIKEYKVNTPLVSAAAKYSAVNAEQVKQLLQSNVRLNAEGDVEVVDTKGSVRYTDGGQPLSVDDLVREFLDSNPHFKNSTPATTNTKTNISQFSGSKVDISKLDLRNANDRKLYAQARGVKA